MKRFLCMLCCFACFWQFQLMPRLFLIRITLFPVMRMICNGMLTPFLIRSTMCVCSPAVAVRPTGAASASPSRLPRMNSLLARQSASMALTAGSGLAASVPTQDIFRRQHMTGLPPRIITDRLLSASLPCHIGRGFALPSGRICAIISKI